MTTNSSQNQPRQPEGQSIGGQFDKLRHGEPLIELGAENAPPSQEELFETRAASSFTTSGPHARTIRGDHFEGLQATPPESLGELTVTAAREYSDNTITLFVGNAKGEQIAQVTVEDLGDSSETTYKALGAEDGGPLQHLDAGDLQDLEDWAHGAAERYYRMNQDQPSHYSGYDRSAVAALAAGLPLPPEPLHRERLGGIEDLTPGYLKDADPETASQLITDLMHWARGNGVDFGEVLRMGQEGYQVDRLEDDEALKTEAIPAAGLDPDNPYDVCAYSGVTAVFRPGLGTPRIIREGSREGLYKVETNTPVSGPVSFIVDVAHDPDGASAMTTTELMAEDPSTGAWENLTKDLIDKITAPRAWIFDTPCPRPRPSGTGFTAHRTQ